MDEYGDAVDDYRDIGNRRMDHEIIGQGERTRGNQPRYESTFGTGYTVPVYTRSKEDHGFDFTGGHKRADSEDIFLFDKAESVRDGFGHEDLFLSPHQPEYEDRNERVSYDYYEGKYLYLLSMSCLFFGKLNTIIFRPTS